MLGWLLGDGAIKALSIAYLIRAVPGILLIMGALLGVVIVAWKHRDPGSSWRFSPRQTLDVWIMFMTTAAGAIGVALILGLLQVG